MQSLTEQEIHNLETLISKFDALHQEFSNLTKKSPDGTINKFKAGIINQILKTANSILGKKSPIDGFTELDLDSLPTYSDATLVISQYIGVIEVYRCDHISPKHGVYYYKCKNDTLQIRAKSPQNFTT